MNLENYRGKYNKEKVRFVLKLLKKGVLQIREISKLTGVPETTINNWRFERTNIYGLNRKLNSQLKTEILNLLNKGYPIHQIARKLKINYDNVRLFLKEKMSEKEYSIIKSSDKKLPEESKVLTPELSYILGVMYGDGHFDSKFYQLRLGAKDKEFVDYFSSIAKKWCNKKVARREFMLHEKPYYECYLCFKDATLFIKNFVGNREKIPKEIIYSKSTEVLSMFIKGFVDSEGTIFTSKIANTFKVYNNKKIVLEQIKEMMLRLGFNKNKLKIVFNSHAKNGDVYALRIHYKDQLKLLNEKIGFTIGRKQRVLNKMMGQLRGIEPRFGAPQAPVLTIIRQLPQ